MSERQSLAGSLKLICSGFRHQHAAFILTCIYLIFEYNRPQQVYPVLNFLPWGKVLLLLGALFAFADRDTGAPPAQAVRPMSLFAVCVLLSTLFAFSPGTAVNDWMMFFSWMFVVLLLTSVVNSRSRLFLFMTVYFLANLKMAQHGFRSWAMGGFGFSGWGVTGSPGWFQNSGEFSLQMVVFLPLVFSYIAFFRRRWSVGVRLFFYLLAVMAVGSIIASGSRGAILGLAMVGLWCLLFSRQRVKALILVVLLGILISLVMPAGFKARFDTVGKDKTSLARLTYWQAGVSAVGKHPWTGVGFRNWTVWVRDEHPELMKKVGTTLHAEVIHNTYLEAAVELGLPGLAVYLLLLLQVFFSNLKTARVARLLDDRFLESTARGLNGGLLGFLAPSYFMSVLYYPYVWMFLVLSVSCSVVCGRMSREKRLAAAPAMAAGSVPGGRGVV
ncbi:O-antigen ligase family protein [Geothermobacter hydrogeniphilus]|uniref:O-antigen ligase-related domain-containing protein n=1 Tax=Geothermobacter hydrogeniphilus TaxID=1969733 RepID=A0A1X0YDW4_9BACT|nr:O-antigen ligase family protein [Geothermobacter hydrogeniphilus]ORJ63401.1 hypothetical protein B5V00_00615 [Geothermobacter hydrogeniphilus]